MTFLNLNKIILLEERCFALKKFIRHSGVKLLFAMLTVSLLLFTTCSGTEEGEDWPAYRHDNRRSGITAESLEFPLHTL